MELREFQDKIKEIEQILGKLNHVETNWIEPENEKYSSISITYEFDEVRVGIDHVKGYYSDKYGKGRTYNDGINRFNELLNSRIKRIVKYKGNFHYRTDYLVERNGKFENFSTMLFWAFPFWRKTKIDEFVQKPIIYPRDRTSPP